MRRTPARFRNTAPEVARRGGILDPCVRSVAPDRLNLEKWESHPATRNWLADGLLRDLAGFHDTTASPTCKASRDLPLLVRAWLRDTRGSPAAITLPTGYSVVRGTGRWAACVVVYVGSSRSSVLSFAYWLLTSAHSRLCGGANLDLTDEDDPFWTYWIH